MRYLLFHTSKCSFTKYFGNYARLRMIRHDLLRADFNEIILSSNFIRKTFFSKKQVLIVFQGISKTN